MCYLILTENGQVVACSTIERVHPDNLGTNSFDTEMRRRISHSLKEEELDVFDNSGKPNPA